MRSKRYCKTYCSRAAAFIALTLVMIISTVYLASCASFDHLTKTTPEFAPAEQCAECHGEIHREWSKSRHAKAFTNYQYTEATGNHSMNNCLGCHAPQPTVSKEYPKPRLTNREDGITCVSCHLLPEGKMSGPIKPTGIVRPHPIKVDPEFYRSSDMCGRCHKGTFSEWKAAKVSEKRTCQQCHMSPVKRKVTQPVDFMSKVLVAFERRVPQGQHDFSLPSSEILSEMLSIEATKAESLVTITIRNNLPHSLPTGDYAPSTLILEAYVLDSKGKTTVLDQRNLSKKLRTSIPAHSTIDWQLKIPPDSQLWLRLRRLNHEGDIANLANVQVPAQ